MRASRRSLAKVIAQKLDASVDTTQLSKQIASFLVSEGKTRELDVLLRDVARLRYEKTGTLEINASSAFPLEEQTKEEIKKLFKADKYIINNYINKELIGGVRIEALDQQADLTVARKLQEFKTMAVRL